MPAAATPYPSAIGVSGVVGTVAKVTATLHGFHHTCAHDVDLLLVGPHGQESILMSDAGDCDVGTQQPPPVELAFDDTSTIPVPCLSGPSQLLQSGLYATTNDPTSPNDCTSDPTHPDVFAAPAPAGPYALALAPFNGVDPNGTWALYAMDQFTEDSGAIDGGWSLDLAIPAGTLGSPPSIKGAAEVGRKLTAASGTLAHGAAAAYQWNRCNDRGRACKPITGATKATYKPARTDRGKTLTLTESAVTSGGTGPSRDSSPTKPVGPPLVSLAGTARSQKVNGHGLRVTLRPNLAGELTASATVGHAKLGTVHRTLAAGRRVRLGMALTAAARAAIAAGAKSAKLVLVLTDASGGRSSTRLTITLSG